MTGITHRMVEANGVHVHLAEAGSGPPVLLCHGWPESWYSWRWQLKALAEAGFHAVAPDMRGYGRTDRPEAIDAYTLFHLVGDMVGVLDALGESQGVIVGHDWGAPVAWHSALFRPDRFRAVAGLSVPFRPRGSVRPTSAMPQTEQSWFYQLYFQEPGLAEAEFERDPQATIRRLLYSASGDVPRRNLVDAPGDAAPGMVPRTGGFLTRMADPNPLPNWLSEADVAFYANEFFHRLHVHRREEGRSGRDRAKPHHPGFPAICAAKWASLGCAVLSLYDPQGSGAAAHGAWHQCDRNGLNGPAN